MLRTRPHQSREYHVLELLGQTRVELCAARARAVEAADAERARIERDLHDGAQQQLLALAIHLHRAKAALSDSEGECASRIDTACAAAAAAIEELNDLAQSGHPRVLRDSGLIAALRVVAGRQTVPILLEIERFERPPAAVEAALYFTIVEALQNAVKHAPGARVAVRIRAGLHFEVTDDGPGFAPDRSRGGRGVDNIRDRIGALGGTVEWHTEQGAGTRVAGFVAI
jgi:signal transduction histidine kinase